MTYKKGWIYRIVRLLQVNGENEMNLRNDLDKMTGHGLARLSDAIEEVKRGCAK